MRTIVITGAGAGLGRALARRLAGEDARLFLLSRTASKIEALAGEIGPSAQAIACDVGDPASVRAAFREIAAKASGVDVLVNNAAVYTPSHVKDTTDEQVTGALLTNLAGAIYCTREALPLMGKGGHIFSVSSETLHMPYAMFAIYQSSKAGLERFMESLHAEIFDQGIRVTTVRASQMADADTRPPADMSVMRSFAEENMKRGIDLRARPISAFSSAAEVIHGLMNLPADINVPHIDLEAWRR
jgi:3-oxoacyl-[acyl-carrier protein] reductase